MEKRRRTAMLMAAVLICTHIGSAMPVLGDDAWDEFGFDPGWDTEWDAGFEEDLEWDETSENSGDDEWFETSEYDGGFNEWDETSEETSDGWSTDEWASGEVLWEEEVSDGSADEGDLNDAEHTEASDGPQAESAGAAEEEIALSFDVNADIRFDELRGGDHTWFFDKETEGSIRATVDVPDGAVWSINWEVGPDVPGAFDWLLKLEEGTYYTVDPDGMGITVNVPALSAYRDFYGGDGQFLVRASLCVNGIVQDDECFGFYLARTQYQYYDLPGFDPGDNVFIPEMRCLVQRSRRVYIQDADHPYGEECSFDLTGLTVTEQVWDQDAEAWRNASGDECGQVAELVREGEDGWEILMKGMGRILVDYEYPALEGNEGERRYGSFEIYVREERYQIEWKYPSSNSSQILGHNSEMTVSSTLTREWMNEMGWHQNETVTDYRLEVPAGYDKTLAELVVTGDGKSVRISSNEAEGDTWVLVKVIVSDKDGSERTAGSMGLHYAVYDSFITFEPSELQAPDGSRLNISYGEMIDFTAIGPKLYQHDQSGVYEFEDVKFRLEYDPEAWQALEADPMCLVRKTSDDTNICLVAERCGVDGTVMYEVGRQEYWFSGLNYDTEFVFSYDGSENGWGYHVLAGEETPLQVSLDLSAFSDAAKEDLDVEWRIVRYGENGLEEPQAATMEVAPDGRSVTITGDPAYVFSDEGVFVLEARLMLGEREVAWRSASINTWCEFLSAVDYGESLTLWYTMGELFENGQIRVILVDAQHPEGVIADAGIVDAVIEDPEIAVLEAEGADLVLKAKNCGTTSMTLTLKNDELFGVGVTRELAFGSLQVQDSGCELVVESDSGSMDMLPNDEMKLNACVNRWSYDSSLEEYVRETLAEDRYGLRIVNWNEDLASVEQDGTIRSYGRDGVVHLTYELTWPGEEYPAYSWDIEVEIGSIYYYIKVDEVEDVIPLGSEVPLNPRIIRRSTKDREGTVYMPEEIEWSLDEFGYPTLELRDGVVCVMEDPGIEIEDGEIVEFRLTAGFESKEFGWLRMELEYEIRICPKLKPDLSAAQIALSKTSYTYSGSACKPAVTVKDGSREFVRGQDYEVTYKNNVNAGTASVTVTGIGDCVGEQTVEFTIEKAAPTLAFTSTSVSKKFGDGTFTNALKTKKTDGKITFTSSNTGIATVDSTTGKVTIKGVGTVTITAKAATGKNYKSGSKTYKLVVSKGDNVITASNITKVTSASSQTVSIGAKVKASTTLTYKSSNSKIKVSSKGTVTIPKNFVGSSTITITAAATAKRNACTKKITVTVDPKPVTLKTLTNLSGKKLQIEWNKNSAVTGYEIMYSKASSFKSPKTITVSKNSTVKYVISSGLTKGSTYYVKIRTYKTVNSKKYYSTWSKVLSKKISK